MAPLQEAVRLLEAHGRLERLPNALSNLGSALKQATSPTGRDLFVPYWERAVEVSEVVGNPSVAVKQLALMAEEFINVGRWGEARDRLRRAGDHPGASRSAYLFALEQLGLLDRLQGDLRSSRAHLEQAVREANEVGNREQRESTADELAQLDLAEGNPRAAYQRAEVWMRDGRTRDHWWSLPITAVRALAAVGSADDAGRALALARPVVELWVGRDHTAEYAHSTWCLGISLLADGQTEAGCEALGLARDLARARGRPFLEASVFADLGRGYRALGDEGRARESLQEALTIFERLGAKLEAQRVAQSWARSTRLSRTIRPGSRDGGTEREAPPMTQSEARLAENLAQPGPVTHGQRRDHHQCPRRGSGG